ncbi:MAG TPA: serine/threonine-protein kinase [Polyangiaceae bacterium]|jgi:serine/threonine-protein kinase|nr:serine/threonine-protein kinase [Polyangiaceae bacterium]
MSPVTEAASLPQLDKYEVLEELGHGGMATVYRARDLRLDREVAVKIIHKHLRENTEIGARFDAEARAVAKLRHPNIVEVYDVSAPDEPDKYIVVELSRGTTLRRVLTKFHDMPPEVAAALGLDLASALAHAHGAGVIHRDLKPENVLIEIGDQVQVKLTDFGIAKILDAQGVTSTGQVLGSPAHMAPEQIEGGEVDARADVFGLGVLLYECMVGHLPFEGKNPAQVLRRVLEGSYAPADREKPTIGGRWAKILARALAKDAVDRYPDAPALAAALQSELEALKIADPRAQLREFLLDAEQYRVEHRTRIVSILTQRGEQSRKSRDLPGAAADYNRALAYAPQDPTLLRLISRMQRGRAARGAILTAFSVAAGAAAVGAVVVALKKPVPSRQSPVSTQTSLVPASSTEAPPASAAVSAPVPPGSIAATKVAAPERQVRHQAEAGSPGPVQQYRDVTFTVFPASALVSIDDGPFEERFMKVVPRVPVGRRIIRAKGPPPSKCCKGLEQKEDIKPDDGSGTPQQISLSLTFHDAKISASSAPEGAELRCPVLKIAGRASQVYSVPMSSSDLQDVNCAVSMPGVPTPQSSVTLRAGELTDVPWTAP